MNVSPISQNLSVLTSHSSGVSASTQAADHVASAPVSPSNASEGTPAASPAVRGEQLQEAVKTVNRFIEPAAGNLEFQIDAQSGRTVMKLIDKETGSVLRQMPSEEMLAIARALDKLSGLVIKLKA
jgi:flagellar protein FlaG